MSIHKESFRKESYFETKPVSSERKFHHVHFVFIYLFIYLFIYFWLRWVFVAARGLSLDAASGGYSSLRCTGFSSWWLLLLQSTGSRHAGFSSCGTRAQQLWFTGSRAQAQQLWRTGLVALWHVGSSWTRARTYVPCIGSRFLTTVLPGKSQKACFELLFLATWPTTCPGCFCNLCRKGIDI